MKQFCSSAFAAAGVVSGSLMVLSGCATQAESPRPSQLEAADRPNVVVIYVDDLGYGDVGVYGAKGFETPHLDAMAADGMQLTSFYVAQPVCSASRAALLTGCYPNRIGINGALGPRSKRGLADEEVTLGELCQAQGYATAVFGKWHLGYQEPFLPTRHGFDEFYGIPYSNDMWPWHPHYAHLPDAAAKRKQGYPDLPMFRNDRIVDEMITGEDQEQFTRAFTEHAVSFIERHQNEPFFVYLAHPMPHVPLFTHSDFTDSSPQGRYGDVIQELDWSVGEVLRALDRLGLSDETLVIFASDNGPWLSYGNHAGTTGPLREGKGSTWEGGVRVPCIVRWPGRVPAGAVSDEPIMTIDLLPTIAGLIDAPLPRHRIDGADVWPVLSGVDGATSPQEAYYFYYHNNHLEAVRSGDWKLVLPHRYRSLTSEPGQDGSPAGYTQVECGLELYNLRTDIRERHDVAAEHPEIVEQLMVHVEAAREDLGDALTERPGTGRRQPGQVE